MSRSLTTKGLHKFLGFKWSITYYFCFTFNEFGSEISHFSVECWFHGFHFTHNHILWVRWINTRLNECVLRVPYGNVKSVTTTCVGDIMHLTQLPICDVTTSGSVTHTQQFRHGLRENSNWEFTESVSKTRHMIGYIETFRNSDWLTIKFISNVIITLCTIKIILANYFSPN